MNTDTQTDTTGAEIATSQQPPSSPPSGVAADTATAAPSGDGNFEPDFDQAVADTPAEEINRLVNEVWGFTVEELRTAARVVRRIREDPSVLLSSTVVKATGLAFMINRSKAFKKQHHDVIKRLARDEQLDSKRAKRNADGAALARTHLRGQRNEALTRLLEEAGPEDGTVPAAALLQWPQGKPLTEHMAPLLQDPAALREGCAFVKASGVSKLAIEGKEVKAIEQSKEDTAMPLAPAPANSAVITPPTILNFERKCHICKSGFKEVHHFYDCLCMKCGDFNFAKRTFTTDLSGHTYIMTGGRIKIGLQIALKLLRGGAHVFVTTRFPFDSAVRYAKEPDLESFKDRLHICFLDLKNINMVKAFVVFMYHRLGNGLRPGARAVPEIGVLDEAVLEALTDDERAYIAASAGGGAAVDFGGGTGGASRNSQGSRGAKLKARQEMIEQLKAKAWTGGGGLTGIINNAAQTVARPAEYYEALNAEEHALRAADHVRVCSGGARLAIVDPEWDDYITGRATAPGRMMFITEPGEAPQAEPCAPAQSPQCAEEDDDTVPAPPPLVMLSDAALSSQAVVLKSHQAAEKKLGRELWYDMYDTRATATDRRAKNSWTSELADVSVEEAADTHCINAMNIALKLFS